MDIEEYLSRFDKFAGEPKLDAIKYLMNEFNNPQRRVKIIHIAGTNGKGSVCEMLSNVLIHSGFTVGKFISPKLIKFNETVCVNNEEIKDEEITEILDKLSVKIEKYNETHEDKVKWFDVKTAIALIYFAEKNCDFAIVETGLGGIKDPTNVVDSMISVITSVGYDHMDVLGDTIEKIAENKAGIIKKNSYTVFFEQKDVINIIRDACEDVSSELHVLEQSNIKDYSYDSELQKFSYKSYKDIQVNLKGKKQIYNAAICLECIDILKNKGYQISPEAIKTGLKTVIHKARFETLSKQPLIIFDGAHNVPAINNLSDNINQYYKDANRIYILSILRVKDYAGILKKVLEDKNAIFIFTDGNGGDKYVSKEELYTEAKGYLNNEKMYQMTLEEAINTVKKDNSEAVIFIIGSFYIYESVIKYIKE